MGIGKQAFHAEVKACDGLSTLRPAGVRGESERSVEEGESGSAQELPSITSPHCYGKLFSCFYDTPSSSSTSICTYTSSFPCFFIPLSSSASIPLSMGLHPWL